MRVTKAHGSRIAILALSLFTGSAVACADMPKAVPNTRRPGSALVRSLSDRSARNAAYCDLLERGLYRRRARYRDKCLPVRQVVSAPQANEPPLVMVFVDPGYAIERAPNRRNAAGPFSIFDSQGFIVPVFGGANLIDQEDELFPYSPHGELAVGHVYGVASGNSAESEQWDIQVLHVVPTDANQQPALSILLGPPAFGVGDTCEGHFWSWRWRDVDQDGWPEIEIGPRLNAENDLTPAATYRWSAQDRRYVGPAGRADQGFVSFSVADARSVYSQFTDYWRIHRDERKGHRRSRCTTGTSSTVTVF